MPSPTKLAARKTPSKQAKKTAAKKGPPSEAEEIRALLARSTPAEQKSILGFVEKITLKMDEIINLQNQISGLMEQRLLTAKLTRSLTSMAKAQGKI